MTAAEKSQAVTPLAVHHDYAALHPHDDEAANLKDRIVDLLAEVESLRQSTDKQNALEDLVVQLRQANQNLVIATFGAQDMQANAEAANRRQEEFLTMLAHELRNPLAPIVTATELLEKIADAHPALPKLQGIIRRQVKQITIWSTTCSMHRASAAERWRCKNNLICCRPSSTVRSKPARRGSTNATRNWSWTCRQHR